MRIVQYCPYTGPARDSMGSERVVEATTKALIALGHEVFMFINPDSKNMPAPVVSEIPQGTDIIHAHGTMGDVLDKYNIPWVTTLHGGGSDPPGSPWHNNPHVICVSKFISDLSGNPAHVHSCVEPDNFIYKSQKENYYAWLAGTDWGEGKGLLTTIALAKKLKFNLKIAGTGKNQKIIELIKSMCDNKIQYVGAVNGKKKAEFLANAKAYILFTRLPDACPLVVAESLVSGTPVIGSINGSMPELIINNKTGILCEEEKDLPKAILNINKIKPEDCRNYALNNFTSEIAAKKCLKLYENMIKFGTVHRDF